MPRRNPTLRGAQAEHVMRDSWDGLEKGAHTCLREKGAHTMCEGEGSTHKCLREKGAHTYSV